MRLLLLSSSRVANGPWLTWAQDELEDTLAGAREIAFVPWAGVTLEWDEYTRMLRDAMAPMGVRIRGVHEGDAAAIVGDAEAVLVGGGNTFRLLERLQATGTLTTISQRVRGGMPYVGWSAGSNVACPTIRTTNDMPVIEPASFDAFGFVPFQINAHYNDFAPPGFHGETRAQRLAEFTRLNPETPVVALREGALLRVRGETIELGGVAGGVLFREGREEEVLGAGVVRA
jgi:dipeptidase E